MFEFDNHQLITEEAYLNLNYNRSIRDDCAFCKICTSSNLNRKSIRKRKKLNSDDKIKLAYDIGMGYSISSLSIQHSLSPQSIKKFKRTLNQNHLVKKPTKISKFSSITKLEQQRILNYVDNYPFDTMYDLKRNLRLQCSRLSIRNFLKSKGVRAYLSQRNLYHLPTHMNIRKTFCDKVKNLNLDDWNSIVFSDEKTLQNFHNGRIFVYKKRKLGQAKR